jgi:outer membrane translocation and assembly module TamA
MLSLSACNVTQYLDESKNERLVVRNTLKLDNPETLNLSQKTDLTYELAGLYKIPPNERSLRLLRARLWYYYRYKDRDTGFSRWVMKKIAEPPALYSEALTRKTASNFTNYLNQRGYFRASCRFENDTLSPYKIATTYKVFTGPQYRIDTAVWVSRDSAALATLDKSPEASLLKAGAPLDGKLFEAEKLRITNTLKNNGYAYFVPSFIDFVGDSTSSSARVQVELLGPSDSTNHRVYKIGAVQVFTSFVPNVLSIRSDTTINDVYYASAEQKFSIRPEKLQRAIALQSGEPYRQRDFDRTIRNLNNLGTYRFISVQPALDSVNPELQNVSIFLTPNKRFSTGGDFGLNTSNSTNKSQLLGLSLSGTTRNRNVFGGGENLDTDLIFNLEFDVASPKLPIFSLEASLNNQLTIPRFFDYLGWWRNANRLHIGQWRPLSDIGYRWVQEEAKTRINLNANYLQLIDFYRYYLLDMSFGYDLTGDPGRSYSIDLVGIDVLFPTLDPAYDDLYSDNDFFIRSFEDQLFTGFLFRNFNLNYYSNPNKFGEHNFLRFNVELSGLEVELANELWGLAFQPEEWDIGGLDFAKFARVSLDGGYIREYNNQTTLATRIGVGIVRPYGGTQVTPYVKQFFVGGPSSIRAFRIREIGPGGFVDEQAPTDPPFYQASDFRFEFNAEYRFPLFLALKGAIFLDGGNVWSVDGDDPRPFSQLNWGAYKQLALGTGLGLRLDMSFFVIRLDMGYPLRRPMERSGIWYRHFKGDNVRPNLNLSVGYPF